MNDNSRIVDINSRYKDSYVSGLDQLSQKVIHALFTETGRDPYDPTYGCQLVNIFRQSPTPNKIQEVRSAVLAAIRKAEKDIVRIQSSESANRNDRSVILGKLQLISVTANRDTFSWEINIRIFSQSGSSIDVLLPIEAA